MRYVTGLTVVLLALVFLGTTSAAQQPPYGSYQQTCRHIEVRGNVLYAECKDADSHWRSTQLQDYQYCRGEVQNQNGNLQCSDSGYQGNPNYPGNPNYSGQYPGGSYQQTCRNIGVRGNVLYAECQDASQYWRQTQLSDYQRCRGDIQNQNGSLQCGGGGYPGGPGYPGYPGNPSYSGQYPYGSYQQTCRNISVRGNALFADCLDTSQNWRSTQLGNYQRCRNDIQNINGNLQCTGVYQRDRDHDHDRDWDWDRDRRNRIPRGSYVQTCQNIQINGNDLSARCQKRNGGWRDTTLRNFWGCRDITNDNGKLRCY